MSPGYDSGTPTKVKQGPPPPEVEASGDWFRDAQAHA